MSPLLASQPPPILLSRVAEAAYWAGRYLERAEGTARMIRTHAELLLDLPRAAGVSWSSLLATVGAEEAPSITEDEVAKYLAADTDNPGSIVASIGAVHHNLRVARVVLPIEAAEVLTTLHQMVRETAHEAVDRTTRRAWLTDVIQQCQMLSGILHDTMAHDDAYSFFTIGRQLERADLTTRVLDVQAGVLTGRASAEVAPWAGLCWSASLRSVSALQAFRRRGWSHSGKNTVTFLLGDSSCPRSVVACLDETARRLAQTPQNHAAIDAWQFAQLFLERADVVELVDGEQLHDFIDDLQVLIDRVHVAICDTYFSTS